MEYRFIGRTGLRVSALCLGAMTFGRETCEEDSYRMMDRFIEVGGNFIDTADVYSQGLSEEIVGSWLKSHKRGRLDHCHEGPLRDGRWCSMTWA